MNKGNYIRFLSLRLSYWQCSALQLILRALIRGGLPVKMTNYTLVYL